MDPATQSVTVVPAAEADPQAPLTPIVNGGTNGHEEALETPVEPASSSADTTNQAPKSYDDLFPSLPAAAPVTSAGSNPIGEWNRKPKLASSTVTQVFRIPVEERRDAASSGFGADDSYKQLKTVMDKTGAKIEMSSSRDQSLTFVITGKQEVVLRARRELLREFQVRRSFPIHFRQFLPFARGAVVSSPCLIVG